MKQAHDRKTSVWWVCARRRPRYYTWRHIMGMKPLRRRGGLRNTKWTDAVDRVLTIGGPERKMADDLTP